ncbi:cell surface protein [Enterococcus sp. RIT-PI-f]|uniref:cell surface protein n=1 Tax=Enterococcus sp. RIT-PI-f TaxID=1690244 RepID=UPI00190FE0AE|nr:cell surface protein [Enterococcus sp. RIT-PI-f]
MHDFGGILGIGILIGAAALMHQNKQTYEEAIGKEIPIYAIHADYNIDVENPEAVVGSGNYVFVGEVTELTGTTYEDDVPVERGDGTTEYVGDAYTQYKVSVLSNIKNELVLNKEIPIAKHGGIREDGSAYDIFENDQLPEVGKVYVFIAYTQEDGSLLVSGANSNILFDESAENLTNKENLESTEEYQKYSDAVDHQIDDSYIDDVKSEYDLSNQ